MDLLLHSKNIRRTFANPSFPGDLQSCIELCDLKKSLSIRSPSQILAFSLVTTGHYMILFS